MPKSLEEGFEMFISWLQPLPAEHEKAKSHKNSVKRCLETNFGCNNFFETGSFGNGTGVRHYSDTDYFARCPREKLWENSSTTLRRIKEELENTFWSTDGIVVKTPAVRIPFGQYASETMEITPAIYYSTIDTPFGNKNIYDIPNYSGGWMRSSPGTHNEYVKAEDDRLSGELKHLIQLVKAWKFYNDVPIKSFYLEIAVTKYASKEKVIVYDMDLYYIIKSLYDNSLSSIQDPMKISGYIESCKTASKKTDALSKLATAFSRAEKAYSFRKSNVDAAFYWWDLFFANEFPTR